MNMIDKAMFPSLRMAAHGLDSAVCKTPAQVVSRMGAMQAQDFNMAKWAVGIRMGEGASDLAVQEAFDRGDFLRTHVLRPTWHFVPALDIRWMLALSAARIKSSTRSRDRNLGLDEAAYSRSLDLIAAELEGKRYLSRNDLANRLESAGIAVDDARMTHIMIRAELEGLVCSGPMRDHKHTYALLSERVPNFAPVSTEEALARLARVYLESHAPASAEDFTWWSGLGVGQARQALRLCEPDFSQHKVDGREYWFARQMSVPVQKPSVHLLPAYDEYIIAYRDRSAAIPAGHHSKAISSNGIFRPVVLCDGVSAGLWRKSSRVGKSAIPEFFANTDLREDEEFAKAMARFALFLGSKEKNGK